MNITLRQATLSDLPLIQYWNTKPHVIFATGAQDDSDDFWLEDQLKNPSEFVWISIAELDNRPIGIIEIVDPANEETHYWGEMNQGLRAMDIWIGEETDLGKGYGTKMMDLALAKCFSHANVNRVLVDPLVINKKSIKFFEKVGFTFLENKYFDEDHSAVYFMDRKDWANRKLS